MADITFPENITSIMDEKHRCRKMIQYTEDVMIKDPSFTREEARTFRKTGWSMVTDAEAIPHIETVYTII